MKLVTYLSSAGPRAAAMHGDAVVDLHQADASLPSCPKALLAQGQAAIDRAAKAVERGTPIPSQGLRLLPPIPNPEKIICVGLNYADHARETGRQAPAEPVLFNKFPTAVAAHEQPIVLPRVSREVDYEAELVVVIGCGGRHIPRERAGEHVAAYCCGNDVSARDWQLRKPGGQWLLGKSFDTFAPIGPWLVTADEIADPNRLKIQLRLNGRPMQDSTTAEFIFTVEDLVAYVSQVCTLESRRLDLHGHSVRRGFHAQAAGVSRARRRGRGGDRASRRAPQSGGQRMTVIPGPRGSRQTYLAPAVRISLSGYRCRNLSFAASTSFASTTTLPMMPPVSVLILKTNVRFVALG